jgi:hypothetical protein
MAQRSLGHPPGPACGLWDLFRRDVRYPIGDQTKRESPMIYSGRTRLKEETSGSLLGSYLKGQGISTWPMRR